MADISPRSRFLRLKNQLDEWVDETDGLMVELEEIADNLDWHFRNISKAKVAGGTGAVAGGILAITGFVLSFFTFGASLGLVIAGGVIGGTGGAVVSGSQITDAVLSKQRRSSSEIILQKYKSRVQLLMTECIEIGALLEGCGNVDEDFSLWVAFWATLVVRSGSGVKKIAWDIIGRTVTSSMRIAAAADNAVSTGAAVTTTAFKAIGSTVGKAMHVTGGVLGLLFLPIDIYTLVDSSIDVHKDNSHKISKKIREMAAKMKKERPTKNDIDRMVKETVDKLESLNRCK